MAVDNVTFTAFWDVPGNPKTTYKLGHVRHAQKNNIDYMFTDQHIDSNNIKVVHKEYNSLPSFNYLNKLSQTIEKTNDNISFKFPSSLVTPSVFLNLVRIWTSKMLLFKEMQAIRLDAKHITWVDCIHNTNREKIVMSSHSACVINRYPAGKFPECPFGLTQYNLPEIKLSACVMKLPVDLIDQFLAVYIDTLNIVDCEYPVYDEEIVLTCMHAAHPDLFHIINN